ncbi:MAG: methylenetetrahydrofolate reductase [Bacteroides sp.]|jgi:methylenetetrahydrofolate reductase (NADPH)|nr:methylenetetrahydrofolate reductase [Bacteroides sp.]
MTIPEHISQSTHPRISYELLPPVKGSSIDTIFSTLDKLMPFDPPFINITYHREEVSYVKQPDGSLKPGVVRKRPGTVGIAAAIQAKYKVDVVPHMICGGFSRQETEDALIDLDFLGIHNLLVVRGDGDKITGRFTPNPLGHRHASELLEQIIAMNQGIYHEQYVESPTRTSFSVGVAGYPEKHPESPNPDEDLFYLKQKVDKGADYIVTQIFYDNQVFFNFVKRCREAGIQVPIIPGLKPISIKDHLQMLPRTFSLTIPPDLVKAVGACSDNKQVKEAGIEWATAQIRELIANGFPFIHIYTMGQVDHIIKISEKVL